MLVHRSLYRLPVTNVVATILILITFLPIFFDQRSSAQNSDVEGGSK